MNRGITQRISNLGEIHVLFPNHFFGPSDFHAGEIFNDTAAAAAVEQLLELRSTNQIVPADLFQSETLRNTGFHIGMNVAESLVILF